MDVIFRQFSSGVKSNRDAWVYNFNGNVLSENMIRMIETYNEQVFKWERLGNKGVNVDDFVAYDDKGISWSRDLKAKLKRGRLAEFAVDKVRTSLYRPFTSSSLFFDRVMNDVVYVFPSIFPTPETETENRVIWLKVGGDWSMFALMANELADQLPQGGSQCFPFYTYDEDGSNRRENITDWALARFRAHYQDDTISKWDIFHYVYGLLHHPGYRERYQANLKRELPRLPFAPDFRAFAAAGARLAEIHVGYEEMSPYALEEIETPGQPLDCRVERDAALQRQDADPLQRFPGAGRCAGGSVRLPAGQPLGAGVGDRPVPGEDGQAQRDRKRSEQGRTIPRYIVDLIGSEWLR